MVESTPKRYRTLWEKEILLIMSNFSCSHNVFKRLVQQTCKNIVLLGNGLNPPSARAYLQKQFDGIFYHNYETKINGKRINSLPNDKISDWYKMKAFAADKIDATEKLIFFFFLRKGRKHYVKRRKCCLPAFFPFPTTFSKGFFLRVVKSRDCVVKG